MIPRIRSAVVLGAGTMGAQIACLLAGAGAQVRLLDLDEATAADGLARALKLRPAPAYRPQDVARIRTGSFDDLRTAAADADWILEAVVERLEPKRALFARVDEALTEAARRPWPIVSTNTSGISIAALAAGRSDDFRRAFLGTHFFNPPRYTRLLELIPIATTAPHVIETLEDVRAAPPRQGHGASQGHPRVHRQPARRLRLPARARPGPGAGPGRRRGRRADGPPHRPSQERDLPDP